MEYIQFPKIAKDFANYLELYYKYQNDYQVEAVLEGRVEERVYDRLEKAPFDERISVTGLLLSALNQSFRQVCLLGEEMELRGRLLRQFHEAEGFPGNFAGNLETWRAEQDKSWENGMVSRQDRRRVLRVAETLEQDSQVLRREGLAGAWGAELDDGEAQAGAWGAGMGCREAQVQSQETETVSCAAGAWDCLRERFGADSDRYESLVDETGTRLEHAFDFMEAAFGGSQEMVLFITELNTGFYSVAFLQQYECQRYYEYNRNLLFAGEEQEIRKSLETAFR